ncbi:hypothetical protein LCGC14_2400150, partial [marine sediment metagenome]
MQQTESASAQQNSTPKKVLEGFPVLREGDIRRSLEGRKWHLAVYSPSGGGKTRLIGTCGKVDYLSPVLLVDMEEGDVTVDSHEFPNIEILRVEEYVQEYRERENKDITPYNAFLNVLSAIEQEAKSEDFPYRLVAFDGCTRLQDWCDDDIVQEARRKTPAEGGGTAHDAELSNLADYRRIASRMAQIFWRIKKLPVHTIATAKMRLIETESSTKEHRIYEAHPNFYPKTGDEFEACFDILARMSKEQVGTVEQYSFDTKLSVHYIAKSRAASLQPKIAD